MEPNFQAMVPTARRSKPKPQFTLCSLHASGAFPKISASLSSFGCRSSRIASTMSGARQVQDPVVQPQLDDGPADGVPAHDIAVLEEVLQQRPGRGAWR